MEQSNTRKTFYIVISLAASLLIWFYANGNAETVISVNDIPVEFLNESTSLADKGLMRIDTEQPTVDLQLRMTRGTVFRLDTDEIRIFADLGSVTAPGTQSINYIISTPNNVPSSEIKVESPSARNVTVNIGELSRKQVEVRCKVIGSVADGYIADSVRLSPNVLEVRGQQEDLVNVNYAQVTLDISGATSTRAEALAIELYDFDDQLITNGLVRPTEDKIEAIMPVRMVKDIPITVSFVESPGARLENVDWTLSADTITLSGDAAVLTELEELNLGTVILAEHNGTKSFTYPVTIPEGLTNLSAITEVVLTFSYKDLVSTVISATRFEHKGLSSGQEVSIITTTLPVTLRGTSAAFSVLRVEDVVVTADLSDIASTAGVYTVPAEVHVEGEADLGVVGEYLVTVRLEEAESEVESEVEP